MRVTVGITGASGAVYAWRMLQLLGKHSVEIHCVVSDSGWKVLKHECDVTVEDIRNACHTLYDNDNLAAAIASGSFKTDAMIIVPCTMHSIGAIANGISHNLLLRAADVMLKEGRKLVIVPRETPLNAIHLANMLNLAQMGVKIVPASPGFYHQPKDLEELVDMMVGRICDQIDIDLHAFRRWQ
ncbi:MAG: 3-octaprenyl-4-hydroxybenzoate carboxy-lyase [Anaerospora sp.]|nr:3-octaprenyl-4-hydroxybenzoate carboxy-lyase [Anaerospora sp.]